jgi:hypothetical protein
MAGRKMGALYAGRMPSRTPKTTPEVKMPAASDKLYFCNAGEVAERLKAAVC